MTNDMYQILWLYYFRIVLHMVNILFKENQLVFFYIHIHMYCGKYAFQYYYKITDSKCGIFKGKKQKTNRKCFEFTSKIF